MKLKRWELVLVGNESGSRIPMLFLRFWRRKTAVAWLKRLNAWGEQPKFGANSIDLRPLVHYELRDRREKV